MELKYEVLEDYRGKKIIYCGDCNRIFEYSQKLETVMRLYSENIKKMQEALGKEYSQLEIETIKEYFNQYILEYRTCFENIYSKMQEKGCANNRFTTLWINISNDCNLRCIYCYGNGGNFNRERQIMDKNQMIKILDVWLDHIDAAKKNLKIIFFGGEPLMNKKTLIYAIHYIKLRTKNNYSLKFGLTTNGTILDNDLLRVFSENDFNITLSIDGGEEIQDINRPFVNGKGSYSVLSKNVNIMLKKNIPIIARLTVTHKNVRILKQSLCDIWDMGITNISFDLVSTNDNDLKLTAEDMDILANELEKLGILQYENIINNRKRYIVNLFKFGRLIHRPGINVCSFHAPDVLKVDVNGNVFKCHRLIGNDEFLEGNIKDEKILNNKVHSYSKLEACKKCTFSTLCIPCYQANYQANQNINLPNPQFCSYMHILIKENIRLYVSLKTISEKYVKEIYE